MGIFNYLLTLLVVLIATALNEGPQAESSKAPPQPDSVIVMTADDVGIDPGETGRRIGGRLLFYLARYHPGDDPTWANPGFDDRDWETALIGLRSDILPESGWPGFGWFRVRLYVDRSLQDRDLGFVIEHAGAVEAFLDGVLVYKSGTVGTTPESEKPRVDQNPFRLPLETGREHVLALRYSSFVTSGFRTDWYYTGPGVYWGDRSTMLQHRSLLRFNQGFFSAFFLAFTLLFALLYGLYRSERLFLYLAVSFGLVVPYTFVGGQLPFIGDPAIVMPLIDGVFAFATAGLLAMLVVLYAFFYPTRPRLFYAFAGFGLATMAAIIARLEFVVFFGLFVFVVYLEVFRVVVVALLRKKRWAWIIGIGIAPSVVFGLWGQLETLGLLTTPWSNTPFSPAMVSILFFSSASATYVGVRFAEANRGLAELETARQLQLSMLPAKVPDHPVVEIAAVMRTATQVGGDYYDFNVSGDGTLTVAIGDATGHGTSAGIMVTAMKSLWNAFSGNSDLAEIMGQSGKALRRMRLPNLYMALGLARLSGDSIEFLGVGLPPALVYRAASKEVETFPLKGIPLGGPGGHDYVRSRARLETGDTVLLMTDGFPERFNRSNEMFGYDRSVVEFAETAERSADEIVAFLMSRCEAWAGGREQDDDVTFVVLKKK